VKFIILCYPRTGSTLLITALGAHPKIRQGMDIFNPEQEGDDPWVHWRQETLAALPLLRETLTTADITMDWCNKTSGESEADLYADLQAPRISRLAGGGVKSQIKLKSRQLDVLPFLGNSIQKYYLHS
jgi:hypothetical protein